MARALNGVWDGHTLRIRVGRAWAQRGVPWPVVGALGGLILAALCVWGVGVDLTPYRPWLHWTWNLCLVVALVWTLFGAIPTSARFNIEANASGLQARCLHNAFVRREPTGWVIGRVESVHRPWPLVKQARYVGPSVTQRGGVHIDIDDRTLWLQSDGEDTAALQQLVTWINQRAGR